MEPLCKCVDAADTYAVQTTRDFVAIGVKLTASVQLCEDNLSGGHAFACVHVNGDAAAIVRDGDRMVGVNDAVNLGAITGEGFIDRVVDHFVDKVVQAHLTGGTDVHGGALAYCFKAF